MKTIPIIILLIFIQFNAFAGKYILGDSKSAKYFDSIPQEYITKASSYKLMFRHASVGGTIHNGLDCIQGTRTNPKECNDFPDYKYDRRNWSFQARGNSGWYGKVDDFVAEVEKQINEFDIFSFKYCYLEGLDQVAEPCGGSTMKPESVKKAWDYLRNNMEMLENKYPKKLFIWWTIPLTQVGQICTDTMNLLIRKYCRENNKYLFDIADIQCHDSTGNIVKSVTGLELAYKPWCGEQQPGAQACHPNWTGSILISKAYWVLMAQISGWNPSDFTSVENNNNESSEINIYPNPASTYIEVSNFNFDLKKNGDGKIYIYNSIGELVIKTEITLSITQKINISDLSSGVYLLKIGNRIEYFVKR